jgi:hypothetical protein
VHHKAIEAWMRMPHLGQHCGQILPGLPTVCNAPAVDDERIGPIGQHQLQRLVEVRLHDDVHIGVDDMLGIR